MSSGHAPVVQEADDAARRVAHVLRAVGLAPLARGDKEVAIGEQEARAEVAAAVVARQGDVDLLDILQARADEPAAGDRGGRIVIVVGARIGEVDQAVLREAGVQRHVEQPALAIVPHLGHARDRLGHEPAVRDDAEPAGALRHQHPPVGQEGEAPGVLQPVHHLDQMETVLGALERAEPLGRRERAGRAEENRRHREQRPDGAYGSYPSTASLRHALRSSPMRGTYHRAPQPCQWPRRPWGCGCRWLGPPCLARKMR